MLKRSERVLKPIEYTLTILQDRRIKFYLRYVRGKTKRDKHLISQYAEKVQKIYTECLNELSQVDISKHDPMAQAILSGNSIEMETALVLINLGSVELQVNKISEAINHFEEAFKILSQTGEKISETMCYLQYQLGVAFLMADKFTEGEERLQNALELTNKIPIEQYLTSSILFARGRLYEAQDKKEEALKLLEQALQIRKIVCGEQHVRTLEVKEFIDKIQSSSITKKIILGSIAVLGLIGGAYLVTKRLKIK